MAVVNKFSSACPDPATFKLPNPNLVVASLRSLQGLVSIGAGDSIGSAYYVGRLPSNARVMQASMMRYGAITDAAVNVGFDVNAKPAALIAAASIAAAGSLTLTAALNLADFQKPLWQLAGYANDPGGVIMVWATLTAAATAGGDVLFDFVYAV